MVSTLRRLVVGVALGVICLSASTRAADELIFSAPPRGAESAEAKVYGPVAEYLSAVTGKKVVYKHSDNWLSYQNDMQNGRYDVVFDGPHFLSWRMAKTQHEPLAKLPGKLAFAVVVRKDESRIQELKDLEGRTVCGLAPPNLATLTMQSQFDNPARQPLIVEVPSFKAGFESMLVGKKCVAAVMRDKQFEKFDKDQSKARAIWVSKGVSNQGFSAGPKFTTDEKQKMTKALVGSDAKQKMPAFFDRFNKDKDLQPASREDYEGLARLLKDVWGFDLARENVKR